MPTERLELIIDAMNFANAELDELKRDLEGVESAGKKGKSGLDLFKTGWGQMAAIGASVAAAGYTAKKAWDFTKEGAQLELTERQFENVATAAGYLPDVLLGRMRQATDGMVSDSELISSGLQIIELGLADSEDQVVTLADAIATLGLDGQQVIMTFANNSEMRLDALGLSVEKVKKRAQELREEGFVGDAFDQAVLEGLTERMELLGDTFETTAGKVAYLESMFSNMSDKIKVGAADSAGPMLDYIVLEERLMDAVDAGNISLEKANEIRRMVIFTNADVADGTRELNAALENHNDLVNYAAIETENWDRNQSGVNAALSMGNDITNTYADRARAAAQANAEAGAATAEQTREQLAQNAALDAAVGKWSSINTNISGTIDAMRERLEFITSGGGLLVQLEKEAEKAMDEGNWSGAGIALDAAKQGAIDLDLELGNITTDQAVAELEELGYGPEAAKAIVEEMQASLFAMTGRDYIVDVYIKTHGSVNVPGSSPAPIGGSGYGGTSDDRIGGETEWATGTGGWRTVPGAPGQPVSTTVHGGEKINVMNQGQWGRAGGGPVLIEYNITGPWLVPSADEAMRIYARLDERARRDAASLRAGRLYTG